MIFQDEEYTYLSFPNEVFEDLKVALIQALVSLKKDDIFSENGAILNNKIRKSEFILVNILNDGNSVADLPEGDTKAMRWLFDLESSEIERENSEQP
jgi:hypothetical protein